MSHCLNPACPKPENPDNANFCRSCGAKLWLGDRYRAIRLIGQGGFGRTFLAIDEVPGNQPPATLDNAAPLSALCVIKQLLPRGAMATTPEQAIDRFRQEAERLAALGDHAQIPKLLAHFEGSDAQYLVQEYIDGDNLETVLQQDGPLGEMATCWQTCCRYCDLCIAIR
jgi:serine/threonine protein kinase